MCHNEPGRVETADPSGCATTNLVMMKLQTCVRTKPSQATDSCLAKPTQWILRERILAVNKEDPITPDQWAPTNPSGPCPQEGRIDDESIP